MLKRVFAYLPSTVMHSMHQSNLSALDIKWDGFKGYEFDAPSTSRHATVTDKHR